MAFFLFFLILSLFPSSSSSSSSSYVPPTNAIRLRGGGLMSNLRNEKNKAIDLALNNTIYSMDLFFRVPQIHNVSCRASENQTQIPTTPKNTTHPPHPHTHTPSLPPNPKTPRPQIPLNVDKAKTKNQNTVSCGGSRFSVRLPFPLKILPLPILGPVLLHQWAVRVCVCGTGGGFDKIKGEGCQGRRGAGYL